MFVNVILRVLLHELFAAYDGTNKNHEIGRLYPV